MKTFLVQLVGEHASRPIEAANDYHAVAEAANCAVNDVAIPIWEEKVESWAPRGSRCYMPLDNTGRQWIVRDAP